MNIKIIISGFVALIISYIWIRQTNWGDWEEIISFFAMCFSMLAYGGLIKQTYKTLQKYLKTIISTHDNHAVLFTILMIIKKKYENFNN